MIRQIFCALIIALGAGLDIYFYAFRFTADGMNLPVSISAAVALELLLAFSVWNMHASKWFLTITVLVTLYAVIQTSAGQTFSLLSSDTNAGKTDVNIQLIEEHKKNLDRLSLEADIINKQLQSIQTTESRAAFGRTVYGATARLDAINADRQKSLKAISDLSIEYRNNEKSDFQKISVYDFYSSMPSWTGKQWLKFLFHTALSVLIALMTPIGIISWNKKTEIVRFKKTKISRSEVENFVKIAWYKIRNNTGATIIPEISYNEYMQREGHTIKIGVYPELKSRCENLGLIDSTGKILVREESDAVDRIMS